MHTLPRFGTRHVLWLYAAGTAGCAVGFWFDGTIWLGRLWAVLLAVAAVANVVLLAGGRASWIETAGTLAVAAFAARIVGAVLQVASGDWDRQWPRFVLVVSLWSIATGATAWIYRQIAELGDTRRGP
jgi:hypothetical protein